MIVFRVQHKEKKYSWGSHVGPYLKSVGYDGLECSTRAANRRPIPYEDPKLMDLFNVSSGGYFLRGEYAQYLFGFASMQDLLYWFPLDELKMMEEIGLVIAKYEAAEVRLGVGQLVFDHNGSTMISVLSLENILDP